MIFHVGEFCERLLFFIVQSGEALVEKARQRQIDLQQAAADTAPAQAFVVPLSIKLPDGPSYP